MGLVQRQPAFQDLLSAAFMKEHTDYPTIQALLSSLGNSFHTGHRIIEHWELDLFVHIKTPFSSWSDMISCAELYYVK